MSADAFLARLYGVRQTGFGRWIARCPAHEDRLPSLSVRELEDGRVLVHCFAGCSVEDLLEATGMDWSSLFPERALGQQIHRERTPFNARDVLACIVNEATVVALLALDVVREQVLADADRERLLLAASRIREAVTLAGGAT